VQQVWNDGTELKLDHLHTVVERQSGMYQNPFYLTLAAHCSASSRTSTRTSTAAPSACSSTGQLPTASSSTSLDVQGPQEVRRGLDWREVRYLKPEHQQDSGTPCRAGEAGPSCFPVDKPLPTVRLAAEIVLGDLSMRKALDKERELEASEKRHTGRTFSNPGTLHNNEI
jgi:hypothetical protein